jgi:hypothetical protein
MADWATISSMATAGGTLVLAVATFSSIRSAQHSARVAERSLLAGQRPLLIPSGDDDPLERVRFGDDVTLQVPGHGGALEYTQGNVYMAMGLRNGGAGLAVIHGWRIEVRERTGGPQPDLGEFRRQQRDLYIPAGYNGFWQGAIRDSNDPMYDTTRTAAASGGRVMVDLLYGDQEGGQRTITRFGLNAPDDGDRRVEVLRYWNVDRADPR